MLLQLLRLCKLAAKAVIFLAFLGILVGSLFIIATPIRATHKVLTPLLACEEVKENASDSEAICVNENGRQEIPISRALLYQGIIILAISGAMLLPMGIVGSLIANEAKQYRIGKVGQPAQAVILDVQETNWRSGGEPVKKYRVQVLSASGERYEATTSAKGYVSRTVIGMIVPVRVDPKQPQDIVLDLVAINQADFTPMSSPQPPQQKSLTDKFQELEASYKLGLMTQQEYEAARQKILDEF